MGTFVDKDATHKAAKYAQELANALPYGWTIVVKGNDISIKWDASISFAYKDRSMETTKYLIREFLKSSLEKDLGIKE